MQLSLPGAVGLGTAPLGSFEGGPLWWGPQDRDEAIATVRAAAEAGVAWIDTAPFYGWGRAEEIVGEALAASVARPLVLTKCGTVRREDGRPGEDASPAAVRRDVQASLRRLRTERLDAVQVHDVDPAVPIEETWGALRALVTEGLVGALGLSNHPVELMDRARREGRVDLVQHHYSVVWRAPEHDGVLAWCERHGVPFLAWSPRASGFLADGFDRATLHPDDLRHRLPWAGRAAATTAVARERLAQVGARHGTTMASVALAWATRHGGCGAIVGARTVDEARRLASPLPVLDGDDLTALDGLDAST